MTFDKKQHLKNVGMKKGETRNPAGSRQKVRIIKSPLRKTSDSLREVENDAIIAIKKAVKGEEVKKEQLETSKWLLGMIQTLDKAASTEEINSAKIRLEAKNAQDAGVGIDDVQEKADVTPIKRLNLVLAEEEQE